MKRPRTSRRTNLLLWLVLATASSERRADATTYRYAGGACQPTNGAFDVSPALNYFPYLQTDDLSEDGMTVTCPITGFQSPSPKVQQIVVRGADNNTGANFFVRAFAGNWTGSVYYGAAYYTSGTGIWQVTMSNPFGTSAISNLYSVVIQAQFPPPQNLVSSQLYGYSITLDVP
jgi:hypothetical protein